MVQAYDSRRFQSNVGIFLVVKLHLLSPLEVLCDYQHAPLHLQEERKEDLEKRIEKMEKEVKKLKEKIDSLAHKNNFNYLERSYKR